MASKSPSYLDAVRSSTAGQVALAAGALYLLSRLVSGSTKSKRPEYIKRSPGDSIAPLSDASLPFGTLDVRRKAQLALGKPTDHAGDVRASWADGFDIDKTIFYSLSSPATKYVLFYRLAVELFWSERSVNQVTRAYELADAAGGCEVCFKGENIAKLPAIELRPDQPVIDFMRDQCDFKMEHADGSFLDHLRFCFEYTQRHYRSHSPRVLLLHSIMGVGTNFFPMTVDKEPQLKKLLSDQEFKQIQAFPSFVRLINVKALIDELQSRSGDISKLKSITVHRVIDNAEITLSAEDLWEQLNFQLIHLLDFLPASNWANNWDDNFISAFVDLHKLLQTAGKQVAHVDVDLTQAQAGPDGRPLSLAKVITSLVPGTIKRRMAIQQQAKLSEQIGHSVEYKLEWA